MKRSLLLITIAILLSTTTLFSAESAAITTTQHPTLTTPTVQTNNNNFYNMGRGVVNIGTCWLELFRCMVYRNSEVPLWGFIAGAVEGSGLTGMRAFGGITDFIFLGFDIGSIYNDKFQEFVWNSQWIPNSSLQNAQKTIAE
jgi:hypothetical protein